MTNYARKTRVFFVFVFVYCLVTVGKSWHGNIAISQVKLWINVEFSELGSSSSRMWWFNFLDVVQLSRCHLALINGFSYTFIHSEKVKEQVCFDFFFLSSSTIRNRSTGAYNSNTKPMSRHFYSIFSTPFLLWKKGSSGPVTQWRQLVSCDWLWHSHGSLISFKVDSI